MVAVPGGGRFFAMTWAKSKSGWHTTIVEENANKYLTREEAEADALLYVISEPMFFNRVRVEQI